MMTLDPSLLSVTGYDANDDLVRFPKPLEMEIVKSFDSPAFSLEVILPYPNVLPDVVSISVRCKIALFDGFVDESTVMVGPEGRRLKILARSKGARLIDNEALPQTYRDPTLNELYLRHIEPYGFIDGFETDINPTTSMYLVPKGASEWEAFANFFRNTASGTAYIDDSDQLICMNQRPDPIKHTFNNSSSTASHYSSVAITKNLYAPISKFVIRDNNGSYSSVFNNPYIPGLPITRKRYLIPLPEYTLSPDGGHIDALLRSIRSMLGLFVVTITCPGLLNVRRAEHVDLNTGHERYPSLFVMQVRHKLTREGGVTVLTLVDHGYL